MIGGLTEFVGFRKRWRKSNDPNLLLRAVFGRNRNFANSSFCGIHQLGKSSPSSTHSHHLSDDEIAKPDPSRGQTSSDRWRGTSSWRPVGVRNRWRDAQTRRCLSPRKLQSPLPVDAKLAKQTADICFRQLCNPIGVQTLLFTLHRQHHRPALHSPSSVSLPLQSFHTITAMMIIPVSFSTSFNFLKVGALWFIDVPTALSFGLFAVTWCPMLAC